MESIFSLIGLIVVAIIGFFAYDVRKKVNNQKDFIQESSEKKQQIDMTQNKIDESNKIIENNNSSINSIEDKIKKHQENVDGLMIEKTDNKPISYSESMNILREIDNEK
jgi:uncharacterized protein HemX